MTCMTAPYCDVLVCRGLAVSGPTALSAVMKMLAGLETNPVQVADDALTATARDEKDVQKALYRFCACSGAEALGGFSCLCEDDADYLYGRGRVCNVGKREIVVRLDCANAYGRYVGDVSGAGDGDEWEGRAQRRRAEMASCVYASLNQRAAATLVLWKRHNRNRPRPSSTKLLHHVIHFLISDFSWPHITGSGCTHPIYSCS